MALQINGEPVSPRALTLPEVRKCRAADTDESDVLAIAWSCGIAEDTAREWFNTTSAGDAARVLAAIFEVSGLSEGAQFPG